MAISSAMVSKASKVCRNDEGGHELVKNTSYHRYGPDSSAQRKRGSRCDDSGKEDGQ